MSVQLRTTEIAVRHWLNEEAPGSIAYDVRKGLTARQKYIPSKYFYDARGSELFEAICHLPEYYPTSIELQLLRDHAGEIVDGLERGDLVELGSGANWKIRTLLEALGPRRRCNVRYVPMDVSRAALSESAEELLASYPELEINGIVGDFTRSLHGIISHRPKLVLFFGSTIGNLDEHESRTFLRAVAGALNRDDRFFLGLDMIKNVEVLEAAYNDSRRITAEFNKNILRVLNREVGADFDTGDFDHAAFFNPERAQIEMHLAARRDLNVTISQLALTVALRKGETIRTEICRKFSRFGAHLMLRRSGLNVKRWFSDEKGWFSIAEIVRA